MFVCAVCVLCAHDTAGSKIQCPIFDGLLLPCENCRLVRLKDMLLVVYVENFFVFFAFPNNDQDMLLYN